MADNELGSFLRANREAVSPEEAGLPNGKRRRTPGLRRSELAMLANVSVEYLTRLEQGHDRHPSPEVIKGLANALNLSAEARVHLHRLSKTAAGASCQLPPPSRTVRPPIVALVEQLDSTPAVVVNYLFDVLAFTSGFEHLARGSGILDGEEPNLVRYVFTDKRARETFVDWETMATERAAALRAAAAVGDPHSAELAKELTASAGDEFSSRFESSGELPSRFGVENWRHPEVGELMFHVEQLEIPGGEEHMLVTYMPANESTETALKHLLAHA